MYQNTSSTRIGVIGLVIGFSGLIVAIVSIIAVHQARLTAAEANLIAEKARLTAEQASATIEEAHLAANQANELAEQANDLARRNEVIRQVVVGNRRFRSSLSRCYQAYNTPFDSEAVLLTRLEEECNVARMAKFLSALVGYQFDGILALQDDLCLSTYNATKTMIERANVDKEIAYLIALFDQSSSLSPVRLDPAPDVGHLLECLSNINEDAIYDFYTELIVVEAH